MIDLQAFCGCGKNLLMSRKSSNFAPLFKKILCRDNWLTGRPAQHSQSR
jgi:hypothetical protein